MIHKNLLEVCTPKQWTTLSTKLFISDGKYPVYGANGIIGHYNDYNHINETVVIGCRGTCGAESVRIVPPYSYVNGNAMCFDNLIEEIDIKFFFYFLKSLDYTKIITGVAQPQITAKSLSNINVPLLPMNIQKNIVRELDAIQNQISYNELLLQNCDDLIKSRFIEMFGNVDFNEKNWFQCTLGEVCQQVKRYPTFCNMKYLESGVRVIRIGNILLDGRMETDDKNYVFVFEKANIDFPDTIIEKNDIIMAVRGDGSAAKRIGIITEDKLIGANISPNLIRIKANDAIILPMFLFYFLTGDIGQKRLDAYVNKTAKKNIAAKDIVKVLVPVPPINLQNDFIEFVKLIDKSKFVYHSKYFLWLIFTFVSSTIAYSNVVSIFECPNRCCTCSIGIPLSIALVASVLLNLCG